MTYQENSELELERIEQELRIEGSRWADELTTISGDEEKVTFIHGFPPCPICFTILSSRSNKATMVELGNTQHLCSQCKRVFSSEAPFLFCPACKGEYDFYCNNCKTEWRIPDLIKAMNMEV